ncbi:hypothetical protein CDL15_Pgr017590 [Punica granatum]|uniref:IAA-alanine resistance protein 1 n=1 Tax=Punica granatum TaxID=22663 RepID=A0A218W7E4_PUNGR|nr:hypothetical protein CDL15_Pgr017590 [Punica granatum]
MLNSIPGSTVVGPISQRRKKKKNMMNKMGHHGRQQQTQRFQLLAFIFLLCLDLSLGHEDAHHHHHHHCSHDHDHHVHEVAQQKLPEELAEEEDLKLYGFDSHHGHHHSHDGVHNHDHEHVGRLHHSGDSDLPKLALWVHALGCSFLVSMASLICLIILPLIFVQGKPSKAIVDSLALFGAGAMLGDAFLHQLPHAFGGEHSHSHDHHVDHLHESTSRHGHVHTLKDLSVGISVLSGIVLFLLVEKLVRYVDNHSQGAGEWNHGHHHHHHHHSKNSNKKLDDVKNVGDNVQSKSSDGNGMSSEMRSHDSSDGRNSTEPSSLRKRKVTDGATGATDTATGEVANSGSSKNMISSKEEEPSQSSSNLVFGYLNLFSDGVHNFTDGMALGSAFLLYGSVGGWSRTLFLLAHELPQEVGDFGILVRSGFSVSKALFFNFLSALVALGGTALSLLWGQDPGQSSLIEGFTAGGFIYIAVAGVLAEMNNNGSSSIKSSLAQLTSLILGMAVALCISLVE